VPNRPRNLRGGRFRHGGGLPARAWAALFGLALSVVAAVPAAAAPEPVSPGPVPGGHGVVMLVTPPRLTIAAGQVVKPQWLEIENRGSVPLTVDAQLEGLAQNGNGSSLLETDAPYSATTWVTLSPDHFQVGPGTRRYVRVLVRVPPNPEPGDRNLAIIFLLPAPLGRGNIHVAQGIGVPVLITVPGPVIDHLSLARLAAPGFSAGGPINMTATVRESGDVHHSFMSGNGRLAARSGGATVLFPPFTVLRDSTVTVTTEWKNPPVICWCHITSSVTSDGQRTTVAATVVIFPVFPVVIGAGVIAALLLTLHFLRLHHRRKLSAAYDAGRRFSVDIAPD
jgi:hypothetical protein